MILDEIAEKTRIRVAGAKQKISPEEMKQKALACEIHREFPFEKELRKKGISFICEVKRHHHQRNHCRKIVNPEHRGVL